MGHPRYVGVVDVRWRRDFRQVNVDGLVETDGNRVFDEPRFSPISWAPLYCPAATGSPGTRLTVTRHRPTTLRPVESFGIVRLPNHISASLALASGYDDSRAVPCRARKGTIPGPNA